MKPRSFTVVFCVVLLALSAFSVVASVLHDDPYFPDPGFAGGSYIADNFGIFSRYQAGRRITRLANGDIVVAGRAEASTMPTPRRMNNIGLVRYSSSGQFVPWSDPQAAINYGGRIIFPNWEAADVSQVKDVVASDDYIFVLHDRQISPNRIDAYIAVFDHAGRQVDWFEAFGTAGRDEFGSGLLYYQYNSTGTGGLPTLQRRLFAVASSRLGGESGAAFSLATREIVVGGNGILSGVTSTPVTVQHTACAPAGTRSCQATRVARSPISMPSMPPRLYVAGLFQESPQNQDMFVMRLHPNGVPDTSFAGAGFKWMSAEQLVAVNTPNEHATGLAIRSDGAGGDDIFVSGRIDMRCSHGGAVFRVKHTGAFDDDFGYYGRMVYGGSDVQPAFCSVAFPPPVHVPVGLAVDGRRLAVAGYAHRVGNCTGCSNRNDAQLVIIDSETGELLEHRELNNPIVGERATHSVAWDVISTGNGRFTLAGDLAPLASAAYPSYQFATIQVRPDRLFGNGFQATP